MKKFIPILLTSILLFSCAEEKSSTDITSENPKKPKNIILLIGDGMGLSQVSASQFFNDKPSNFDRFSTVGLLKTSASGSLITDSAASATAYACGIKTYNGAIGVDTDSIAVKNIVEQISPKGIATGLIATSSIVHATPASFFAHTKSRRSYEEIAEFLPNSEIDFFAGGGLQFFNKRTDDKNLLLDLTANGFIVDTLNIPTAVSEKKHAILLGQNAMPPMLEDRGSFLPDATKLAIEALSKNEEGFFLMIEGSQIDWGGHANDSDYLISELKDFDQTIGVVLDFAEKNGETLVIVTADHETGGFTLGPDGNDYNKIKPVFSIDGHSGTMIPVFSEGVGASKFGGISENNTIYDKMMSLFDR